MSVDYEEKNLFIISNDFIIKEDEKISFMRFFDPLNIQYINFIMKPNQNDKNLYIAIKQDNTKSAFMGNILIPAPVFLYIKKFEPLLLVIVLISLTIEKENKDEIDFATILNVYSEEVKKGSRINEQDCLNFVKKLLYDNADRLELICNVKKSDLFEENLTFKFTMLESKVFDFLNSKINLSKEQNDAIKGEKQSEKDTIERIMIKERFDILAKFLPIKIMNKYAACKNIKLEKPIVPLNKANVEESKTAKVVNEADNDNNVEMIVDDDSNRLKRKNDPNSECDLNTNDYRRNKNDNKQKMISHSIMNDNNIASSCFGELKDNTKSNNKSNNKKTAHKSAPEIKLGQTGIKSFFTAANK